MKKKKNKPLWSVMIDDSAPTPEQTLENMFSLKQTVLAEVSLEISP